MPTALITGGSVGIGAAFASSLAARGDDLVLVARDTRRLEEAAESLRRRHGILVDALVADLSDRDEVQRVADRVADPTRPIDLLVNNAGFGVSTRLTDPDLSQIERGLDVMCRAVLVLGGAAGAAMRERGHGAIVNVSSVAGFATMGGYSAIKAWVTSYTEGLATELSGTGVTATALCPGFVHTEFHQRARINMSKFPDIGWVDADEVVATCLRDVARGRVVSIPTRRYRALTLLARHAPRFLVRRASGAVSRARHH